MSDLLKRLSGLSAEQLKVLTARLKKAGGDAAAAGGSHGGIKRIERDAENFPLSFQQERLWFIDQMEPGNPAFNNSMALRSPWGIIEIEQGLNDVVRRHEILRSSIDTVEGRPVQVFAPSLRVKVPVVDLRGLPEPVRMAKAAELAREEGRRRFNLKTGPLVRAVVITFGDDDHMIVGTLHHTVSDGYSISIFQREFFHLLGFNYRLRAVKSSEINGMLESFASASHAKLPDLNVQYADYAAWQREQMRGDSLDGLMSYWKKQLAGMATLSLPTDRPRRTGGPARGARRSLSLSAELAAALNELSKREGATIFMTMLAAYKVLLQRYSGQSDVVVGSPIAGRDKEEVENLLGFFVNMLVLRSEVAPGRTFREVLGRVKETCLGAYAHQEMPFAMLVKEFNPERDLGMHPLFQVGFQLNNTPTSYEMQMQDGNLPQQRGGMWLDTQTAIFDLNLTIDRLSSDVHGPKKGLTEGGLRCVLEYDTGLFDEETADRMINHYARLLEKIVEDADRPVEEIEILSGEEKHRLLVEWNDTRRDYERDACAHELFERFARTTPDRVAVVHEDEQITYGELNRRANRLAHHLRAKGVGPDTLVGLCAERSVGLYVSLLGILKAGGAYMPLDASYPEERLRAMLAGSGARIVVAHEGMESLAEGLAATVVCTERDSDEIAARPEYDPHTLATPENLAYVMFTSGSTGEPKGVAVTHRNVVRLVRQDNFASMTEREVILGFAPVSFDASTFEVWGALANGGRLAAHTAGPTTLEELGRTVEERGVTAMWLTAELFHQAVDAGLVGLRGVRQLLAGGDALSLRHVERAAQELRGCALINGYGPTEGTTFSTSHRLDTPSAVGRSVPIGRPIANARVYITDGGGGLVPVGATGELFVGGDGLARGYMNRPELTAERFVPDPFSTEQGARLYRTGDLVRHRADGAIEFLGRADEQVKIRGFRIELGEIETTLATHPAVQEAVVTAREDFEGHKRLAAYVVCTPGVRGASGTAVELNLTHEQVSQWETTFDHIYSRDAAHNDPTFNIVGWNSNYTDEPIPPSEMQEWLDDTVGSILSLRPRKVFEIGCGTGLLLFKIAPRCELYRGTDVSKRALDYIQGNWAKLEQDKPRVEILQQAADCFEGVEPETFDTVILNSVIQYFPNAEYLGRVLEDAVRATVSGGSIFIGDVRSLSLLEPFYAAVSLNHADRELPVSRLRQHVQSQAKTEDELAVDPAFFFALKRRLSRVSSVEVFPKQCGAHNELTQFRYQVVIRIGAAEVARPDVNWIDWEEARPDLDGIRKLLAEASADAFGIRGVANARIVAQVKLAELIRRGEAGGAGPRTAGEMHDAIADAKDGAIDPHHLWRLGEDSDYEAHLSWARPGSEGRFDVIFLRKGATGARQRAYPAEAFAPPPAAVRAGANWWDGYANNPLRGNADKRVRTHLRRYLQSKLPEYMVPATFELMDSLPLTRNGKVDRKALQGHETTRAESDGPFVQPRKGTEQLLAEIWAQVLRLEKVGVHDNFFELGGDSILAIQIISKANQAGLQLSPRQIFQSQTIAELAATAGSVVDIEAEQSTVEGAVPLTPVQSWFFELEMADPQHFNQSRMLEVATGVETRHLRKAIDAVVKHHDALRLRFGRAEGVWEQTNSASEGGEVFVEIDLAQLPEERRREALKEEAERVQAGLDLREGPIVRAALFDLGAEEGKRLLIVVHHLAVDGVSWRILLEDIQKGYEQSRRGVRIDLGRKTTSFKQWAEKLGQYARGEAIEAEAQFWNAQAQRSAPRLPLDHELGENTVESARSVVMWLDEDETRSLLQDVPSAYRTQINDSLLAALALSCGEWTGGESLLIDLEGHGREDVIEGADVTRTVGWFTTIYPVLLDLGGCVGVGEAVKRVKEQLRAIPNKGMGYGLLKYMGGDDVRGALREAREPEIVFNYLGQLGQASGGRAGLLSQAKEGGGPTRAASQRREHALEVNGCVLGGRLQLVWTYSESLHRRETVEALAESYKKWLKAVIEHCASDDAFGYTPSDFPLSGLNQAQLDALIGGDRNVEDIYRLSPMQEGLLFHSVYRPEDSTYLVQMCVGVEGDVSLEELEQSWQAVASKNEGMRASFVWEGVEQPVQVIRKSVRVPVEFLDWTAMSAEEQRPALERFLVEDRRRGLDLREAPLMRITLIRKGEKSYQWVWSYHHILMDGWSMPIVLGQLSGKDEAAGSAAPPYRDYIEWLQKQDIRKAESFWRESLSGFSGPTRLGVEKTPEAEAHDAGHGEERVWVRRDVFERLERSAREHRLTVNTLVQGGWALLLSRYSGERDVVYGATVSGRPADLAGMDRVVGLFINTLPIRVRVRPFESAADWLKRLQDQQSEMRQYEYSPLVQVQTWSDVPRGEPLFESIFAYENYPMIRALQDRSGRGAGAGTGAGARMSGMRSVERTNYPLSVVAVPGDGMLIKIIYDRSRYGQTVVARMARHYESLLESFADGLERNVAEVEVLTEDERRQVVEEWNDTSAEYDRDCCIHEMFERQAAASPDSVAVVYEDEQVTYGELNRRANRLARRLRADGVGPESLVGVCVDRSVGMLVSLLGILKAGGAYLPLDPQYPRQRLQYMLDDARVSLLITTAALSEELGDLREGRSVILLDADWPLVASESAGNLSRLATPRNTAYVIYTSGSTGAPKGVMVEHGGASNMAEAQMKNFGVSAGSRVLQFASLSFDASIFEIVMGIKAGARLCLAPKERLMPGAALSELLSSLGVTHATLPPSAVTLASDDSMPSVETMIVAGEACSEELAARWSKGRRFFNAYGPTEATVWSSVLECSGVGVPTIGRPISNTRIYILDRDLNPVPTGARGEIYIAGDGLARGYVGRADLTAERFVPDAYGRGGGGSRLYRTGDLGRHTPEGEIEFLGRADDQVKVRGYRIELGEIESVLREDETVADCVVVVRGGEGGEKRLVAYVVTLGGEADAAGLRAFLKECLPDYMIPSAFVTLESIPLTANGKIDRRALPDPAGRGAGTAESYVPPRDEAEEVIAAIWREVLGVERVGVNDNFFDLGGHSLLMIRAHNRLQEAFKTTMPMVEMFRHPTVRAVAAHLSEAGEQESAFERGRGRAETRKRLTRRQKPTAQLVEAD